MYFISKRLSATTVSQIAFDEPLRERFCERLRQQSMNPTHPHYSTHRLSGTKRNSAVLIPLIHIDGSPSVVFTHRSLLLADHRGEVSFPGGHLEQGETHQEAALRESKEEIGLDSCQVEIWGHLKHVTTRNAMSSVTPIVGLIQNTIDFSTIKAKCDEVQTVFAAPVDELFTRHRYTHFRRGNMEYRLPIFFTSHHRVLATNVVPQKEYQIWGLTAGMLHLALLNLFPKFYQSKIDIVEPIN
uniref:Nudix hydrolase domain-containing protein n=1 Tax=Setaria digitata TaxID=48799 RepID=A0A915PYB8_9BILA